MRNLCIAFVAAAILLSWSGTADAVTYGTLTATWGGVDAGTEVHYVNSPMNDGSIYVGRYNLTGNSQTWAAGVTPAASPLLGPLQIYCIDTYQWANTGTTIYTVADLADGPLGNGAPAMKAEKAVYLRDLIYHYYGLASDPATKAVFAAAVWEIVYEPIGSWNVASGNVLETGWSTTQLNLASTWLGSLHYHDHGNTAYALLSSGYQDFAVAVGSGGHSDGY